MESVKLLYFVKGSFGWALRGDCCCLPAILEPSHAPRPRVYGVPHRHEKQLWSWMIIDGPSEKPEHLPLWADNQLPTNLGVWGLELEFNLI